MKPKLLLGLALVLSGGLPGGFNMPSQASATDVTDTNGPIWGETVGGFQMVATLDETNGIIHCRIRNATTNEMDYPSSDFGYVEFVHLEIRESTSWIELAAGKFPGGGAAGFLPYFTKKVKPLQIITTKSTPWPVQTREAYLKMCGGNTNEALLTERLNKWLADRQATCQNDTFAFDLVGAIWPTNSLKQPSVKIRALQTFRANGGETDLVLYSPEFTLDGSLIQSYINQDNKLHGK